MKKIMALVLITAAASLFASGFQIGVDLRCLDSAFYPSVRIDLEASYRVNDSIRVSVPLRYSHSLEYELDFIESGLLVSLYPFNDYGFFCAVSMIRAGITWGFEAPDESTIFLSEAIIGWTFELPHCFIEPRFCITDIFSSSDENYELLKKAIPQYSQFRISLLVGFAF